GDVDKTLDGVSFKPRREFRILAVPVRANYGGTIKEPGNFADADLFLRKVFPLANENVKFEIGPMQDLSDRRYDLNTEDGRKWAWLKIRDLQPDKYVSPQYDAIVGFVAEPILLYETDQYQVYVQGFTVRKPAALVALGSGYQTTLAHEIAHYFNIGDEYNGGSFNLSVNPPPLGYTGTDWDTNAPITSQASDVKPAAAGSGSLISSQLHPFEFGKRRLLGDEISFMGSGATSEFWISPAIWKHLYNTLAPQSTAQAAAINTEREIVAAGLISDTGIEPLVPWFSYIPDVPAAIATGTHSIRAVDETGSTLATQGFTPYFTQLTNPPMTSDKGVFEVAVPLPAGTRAYQIFAGETLLGEIPVSPEAPVISITKPSAGETLSGEATIEWTASDADSSELFYRVEYSPDGNQWMVLESALPSTQYVTDFATLPGGSQALIRVTATDGINTAIATSPAFEVPLKAPEVYIQSPTDSESISLLEGLFLQGRAYDPQEQWIYDPTQLVWTSDKDGELGRGPAIFLDNLSAGTHVITLQATNSAGMSSAKSVTVTAENNGNPPVDECFIATAAFGSKLEPSVVLLRQFRDRFLLSNGPGRAFVDFYYRTSPPIAAFIAGSEPLQALVRVLLIPVIVMAYSIMQPIAGIGFICILIFILVLKVRRPRVLAK
ncbi:MAG: PKD domain-containing protein, partial [Syntrophomonas sp.]